MAQTIIKISVKDKIATTDFEEVVSFNHNTYGLQFEFDGEWNEFEHRIAVVMWAGGCSETHFTGTECEMPAVLDADCDMALVGVYSTNGERKIASSFVRLRCLTGAHDVIVPETQPSIHEQILSFLNQFDWTVFEKRVKAGVYSSVRVNSFGIVTEGWDVIEIGTEGQEAPSSRLVKGGIFFRLENGVYTLNYYTDGGLVPLSLGASGVKSVNGKTGEVTLGAEELGLANVAVSGSYNDLKDKPTGMGSGAVSSVNGKTGDVTLGAEELGLANVAVSGSYNDLKDKPAAGSGAVSSVNGKTGDVTLGAEEMGLANVAVSGSYNDLTDKPTGGVNSVNGKTGDVTLTKTNIGLNNVLNARQIPVDTKVKVGANLNLLDETKLTYVEGNSTAACKFVPTSTSNPVGTDCRWIVLTLAFDDYDDNIMQLAFSARSDCAIRARNCTDSVWGDWVTIH